MWLTDLWQRCPLFRAPDPPAIEHPIVADDEEEEPPKDEPTRVSRDKIDEIVAGFMQNNSVNNPLLPDFIEKAIYKNVITLMLGIAEEVLSETSIEVLGHRIQLRLTG